MSDFAEDQLVAIGGLRRMFNVCDRTFDRWLKDPNLAFPKPKVIRRRRYWRLADLKSFKNNGAKAA
jgi:hypothetical protein